jgi:hypothetical protein
VYARAKLNTERAHGVPDCTGAANGASGSIEGREEPVARRIDLVATELAQLIADEVVVSAEEISPLAVAHLGRLSSRIDDVGEEHRREYALGFTLTALARSHNLIQEALQFREERLSVAERRPEVASRKLDESRTGNVRRQVPSASDVRSGDVGSMQHERRHADRGKDVGDIHVNVPAQVGDERPRAHAKSKDAGKGLHLRLGRIGVGEREELGSSRRIECAA